MSIEIKFEIKNGREVATEQLRFIEETCGLIYESGAFAGENYRVYNVEVYPDGDAAGIQFKIWKEPIIWIEPYSSVGATWEGKYNRKEIDERLRQYNSR